MGIAQQARLHPDQTAGTSHDVAILLGYVASAILFMIAIHFAALAPGTSSGELATMTVFP